MIKLISAEPREDLSIKRKKASESKIAIIAAISANVLIAAMKFVASSVTGSSAMLSEGIHSLVDTGNGLLLLYGINRSKKPPDKTHQFGYGRELYFWSFIVAIIIFAVGGGVSLYEGIIRLQHPVKVVDPFWNYVVLGASFLFEGTSLLFGLAVFRKGRRKPSIIETIRSSKDPSIFMVVLEDSIALIGLTIALIGIALGHWLELDFFDGLASVLIGLLLSSVALLLGYKAKELLIGEAVSPEILNDIRMIVESESGVKEMIGASTIYIGAHNISVALELLFDDSLTMADLRGMTHRIETRIREKYPDVTHISYRSTTGRA